jgi:hypothetical protein
VHVTQDASPEKWSAAPKKRENFPARRSADGTSASALAAQRKCKTHVPLSFFEFSSVSSEENRQTYTDWLAAEHRLQNTVTPGELTYARASSADQQKRNGDRLA